MSNRRRAGILLLALCAAAAACDDDPTAPTVGLTVFGNVRTPTGAPVQGALVHFLLVPAAQQAQCAELFTETTLPVTVTDAAGAYHQDLILRGAVTPGIYCVAVRVDPPAGADFGSAFGFRAGLNITSGTRPLQQVRIDLELPVLEGPTG